MALFWKGKEFTSRMWDQVARNITTAAIYLEGQIKLELSKPGRGKTYTRRGVKHTASAPGDPPAVDTGWLRASITHQVDDGYNTVTALVGTNLKYGRRLELGSGRIAPRPYLRPTFQRSKKTIARIIGSRGNATAAKVAAPPGKGPEPE